MHSCTHAHTHTSMCFCENVNTYSCTYVHVYKGKRLILVVLHVLWVTFFTGPGAFWFGNPLASKLQKWIAELAFSTSTELQIPGPSVCSQLFLTDPSSQVHFLIPGHREAKRKWYFFYPIMNSASKLYRS